MEDLLKAAIVLKVHPTSTVTKPCTLQPLMLLPREDLPLSSLDLFSPHGDLSSSRLYESLVKILDLEDRVAERPSLLLARNEASKSVYALERATTGTNLYTVCKLGSWVDLLALSEKATVVGKHVARMRLAEESRESQQGQAMPLTTPALHRGHKEKRLAIEALQQSIVRKRGRSQSVSTFDERAEKRTRSDDDASRPQTPSGLVQTVELKPEPTEWIETHLDAVEPTPQPVPEPTTQQTAGDIMDTIRTQYTEALYKSMGSLAYFAKGPLSRARAAFYLDCDGTMDMNDLIEFLKSLVMTTVQIDKKYREAIPDLISKMKTHIDSSDEGSKSKRRKIKKMKMGKDGMYSGEDEHVRAWWNSNKPEFSDEDMTVTPAQIKSHVSLLRTRETQLQMILILEILALEPLRTAEAEGISQLPGHSGEGDGEKAAEAQAKKRSRHNFPVLVDVHADRLTIWQSTASDELRLLEGSQITAANGGDPALRASADPLKDFCTDIIMPFFAARLPEICDSISRKLGGPVIIAPPKPKAKPSLSKINTKPGAAAKRPSKPSSKNNIEKALFKEQSRRSISRGPSNAIALLRSATSANISGFKRENSELDRKSPMDRTGLLSRSQSMTALDDVKVQDVKAQKKALVEAELKDAITAIRKPNRDLAGKAIVEDAAKRVSGGLSSIKKSKKPPTRHPLFESVQVKVTPATHRFRDALSAESQGTSNLFIPMSSIPPSSASRVPSTGPRRGHIDVMGSTPSSAIQATPIKRGGHEAGIPPSSPLMARKPARTQYLSVPGSVIRTRPEPMRSPSPDIGLPATPCKQRTVDVLGDEVAVTPMRRSSLALPPPPEEEKPKSIYTRLGWDDDFDDF
ncbi:DNA replication regulator SLD3-domain-containing protein [Colletotrichum godetiae]|uniref:DNA replication regulator SLD3-domain-containing protein n=1 Tax=Colletotrichum godetiae TaxID=1209918 RepID=A0AAJ0ASQ8_9PEZI|nr:DNA replication regulator SLD3-domain-containing protein [Colletotrichum godetiae]KAK1688261.1 DNA replication regulator SLD3-domain-containing protein [Colletotrichum godetiae]